jgi:RND superfamily putative drug exporter
VQALARLAGRRPWWVVAAAAVVVALGVLVGVPGLSALSGGGFDDPEAEAARADARISESTGAKAAVSVIALVRAGADVRSPEGRAVVDEVARRIETDPDVREVRGAGGTASPAQISRDGRSQFLIVSVAELDAAGRLLDDFAADERVLLGGAAVVDEQANAIVGQDLVRAELIAFPLLFLISLWVFRGVVAALLPVLVGVVSILTAFLGLRLAASVGDVSTYALNLVTGLGLGLAIDYSLLVVSRYREEIARTGPGAEALGRTMATAGRSVLYSALTVGAALSALMVFPQNFLFSMGLGGLMVALIAGVVALVLLPAVLVLLGARVNALAPARWRRASESADQITAGFWYRLSRWVMRRARLVAAATAGALLLLGTPALGIAFTTVDASVLPPDQSARQVAEALGRDFPIDPASPVLISVDAPAADRARVEAYRERLAALPGVRSAAARPVGPDTWRLDVLASEPPYTPPAEALVRDIRSLPPPPGTPRDGVLVGGATAAFLDQKASLAAHVPIAVAIVAVVTIVILFLMTGSVLLPVKAVIMNLLTLSATLGIMVLIFQDGRLEGPLGFTSQGGIDATQPILLAALAFGLSTDYAVFLLSRIKEARDAGASDRDAVAIGLERTGRIVTAAALLFCVAVGSFATSQIVIVKELGVGTALAVLIDATIIRALLVPSLMALLGRWNWWAPRPLRRLHARIGLGET